MNVRDLRPGDVFLELSSRDETPSGAKRRKQGRVTYERLLGACVANDRIHIKTSAGDWCIPEEAPVKLLERDGKPFRQAVAA